MIQPSQSPDQSGMNLQEQNQPDNFFVPTSNLGGEESNANRTKTKCSSCNQYIEIGDYPFCPHGKLYERSRMAPIIVYQNAATGDYWFPANSNDKPANEADYKRIEIDSIRANEKLERDMNSRIREERQFNLEMEKAYFDRQTKERRQEIDNTVRRLGLSTKYRDYARQYVDQVRELRHSKKMNKEIGFHNQVLNYDSSNRAPHASASTGWKDRKY